MQAVVYEAGDLINVQCTSHSEPLQLNRTDLLNEAELMVAHLLMQHGFTGNALDNRQVKIAGIVRQAFLLQFLH